VEGPFIGEIDLGGTSWPDVTITVMESDETSQGTAAIDFIGEVTVSADGSCKPGRATLDEGVDEKQTIPANSA